MSRTNRLRLALSALLVLVSCAPYRPPFTQPRGTGAQADPRQAAVVFLWPSTSCDPAGYLTLATADGRFLGNISRGSRLSIDVPAGESTVVAWNGVMEAAIGSIQRGTVAVLRADLRAGRTYYVRVAFGAWDENGPPERGLRDGLFLIRGNSYSSRFCVAIPEGTTSAMIAVPPASEAWSDLPEWMATLEAMAPDRAAGQTWLDGNHALLESHVAIGQNRLAGLRPLGRRLATLEPGDGTPQ